MKSAGRKLTQKIINTLPTSGPRYVAWDADVRGFGVRVSAGAKTYVLKYRLPTGRVRWASLGRVEDRAVEVAREKARSMRGHVADGKDPLREKDVAKDALTVADVCTRFLREHAPQRKPGTQRMYQQVIGRHIRPHLGAMPIADITGTDAARLHHRLHATPYHANRTLAVLSKLLSWAMHPDRQLRPAGPHPCHGLEKFAERARKRYLTPAEYARLGRALRTAKHGTTIGPGPLTAIELLLLTGARPAEVATLQWVYVDVPGKALRLPDSKTGEKTIHLSPEAVRLLTRWPRHMGSPYVFPGTGRRVKGDHLHPNTLAHVWEDLRTAAGLTDCRLYDAARHSFASVGLTQHNLSLAALGEQLGHTQAATTKRYSHLQDDVAKANAAKISGSIAAALKRRAR